MTRDPFIRDKSARGISTMLSLLVAGRLDDSRHHQLLLDAFDAELTARAMQGAKQGDC